MTAKVLLAKGLYEAMLRNAEQDAPREACGFLFGPPGGEIAQVVAIRNAAEEMRRESAGEFTRSAETGYVMDPKEQMRALRAADEKGFVVHGVYHSHVDVGAYFSAEDRTRALFDGEPMFADAAWLVADVRKGKGVGAKAFAWNPSAREFVEIPLEIS